LEKEKIIKYIAGIVILISVLVFIFVKRETANSSFKKELNQLPKFNVLDVRGNDVKSSDFKGKNVYLQFIDPIDPDDIDLAKKIYWEWKDRGLQIVFVTKEYSQFVKKTNFQLNDTIAIHNNYERLKELFHSPIHVGSFHLFNTNGKIISQGNNRGAYEKMLRSSLNEIIYGKSFSISDFIKETTNIHSVNWLEQIGSVIRQGNEDFYLISLHTKICDSCSGGMVIRELKIILQRYSNQVRVVSLLPRTFSENDIVSLKKQLNIEYPILIADDSLNQKWSGFIQLFSEDMLSDIIVFVDKMGNIMEVVDKKCNCTKQFFTYINNFLDDRRK